MQIIKADILGFCFGVRRAVELAQNAILENPNKNIYSLGPLIHNEIVLNELSNKGLKIIEEKDIEKLFQGDIVLIRAHGTSPDIFSKLENRNCTIIDATCPRVKKSQNIVKKQTAEKDFIIFTGDKNHGEVKSIEGCGKRNFILVQNKTEVENFFENNPSVNANTSILLMSQTTFSESEFNLISQYICKKNPDTEINNTICSATKERQEALIELCKKVEGVIVIGGKTSANSKRLYQIAKDNCNKAAFIQSADEIPQDFLNLSSIGITAGASTPDTTIQEVQKALSCSND